MSVNWKSLPGKPGVYLFKNDADKVIYVGKAKDLRKRVSNYFSSRALDAKTLQLVSEIKSLDHIIVGSEIEAFLLEASLIRKYRPYFNIKFSDDKSYPYLVISRTGIPYVSIIHKHGGPPKGDKSFYFGPYISGYDVKIILRLLRRIFPYQSVKNHPPRRCLYNHIGLCPCIPVYPEKLPEYKKTVRNLVSFFNGDKKKVVQNLKTEQNKYVRAEEFEKASEIQRKIEKIGYITSENYQPFKYEEKPDFYYERIKDEVASLSEIMNKYGLDVNGLRRIECYDISNISGKNATGSMVVFIDGDSSKKDYRRFKIRFKKTPDDFAMHSEVMRRRIKREEWDKPDLMVIDGGKGQVSSVLKVFAKLNYAVPVIGLAKREETIVVPIRTGRGLDFLEVKLPKSTPGINLLRRIRDEAHRFAITYHRLLRKKALEI